MSKCELCGTEVTIVGNTTKHYVPIRSSEYDKAVLKLVEAVEWEEQRCGRLHGPLADALFVWRKVSEHLEAVK